MRTKRSIGVAVVAVLLALSTVTASGTILPQPDAVEVSLKDVEAAPDETITVPLSTGNVDDLAGYQTTIDYDSSVLELEGAAGVGLPDPTTNVDDESGTVSLTQSAPEAVDANPDPVLAELTFAVVGESGDESALDLKGDDLNVNGPTGNLPTTSTDGGVTVVDDGGDDGGNDGDGGSDAGGTDDTGAGDGTDDSDEGDGGNGDDSNAVAVSVQDVEGTTGEVVAVTLETSGVEALAGYEATVAYDPAVVRFEGGVGLDLADPITEVDRDAGSVRVTQTGPESVAGNPNPDLETLVFSVVGETGETSALALEPSELNVNDEDEVLATSPVDGSVTVVAGGDSGDGSGTDGTGVDSGTTGAVPTGAPSKWPSRTSTRRRARPST